MNIKQLFSSSENITIQEYLKRLGVDDVGLYLHPNRKCIEDVKHYDGMDKAWNMIKENIE